MRIGVFDSGVGGLTVLKELLMKYPDNEYIYYGDNKNAPYGDKTKEELMLLATRIVRFFENRKVDIIIIACGTVSSNIYSELKNITETPLYDIVSPTINYLNSANYKKVLLLATARTVDSKTFEKSLNNITSIKCPLLVPLIEKREFKRAKEELEVYLKEVDKDIYDAVILGCTHYPIIESTIQDFFPNKTIINMATILVNNLNIIPSKPSLEINFSKLNEEVEENINSILNIINE